MNSVIYLPQHAEMKASKSLGSFTQRKQFFMDSIIYGHDIFYVFQAVFKYVFPVSL